MHCTELAELNSVSVAGTQVKVKVEKATAFASDAYENSNDEYDTVLIYGGVHWLRTSV